MDLDYTPLENKRSTLIESELTDLRSPNNVLGTSIISIFSIIVLVIINPILIVLSPVIFYLVFLYFRKSGDSIVRLSNFAVKNDFDFISSRKSYKSNTEHELKGVMAHSNKGTSVSSQVTGKYKDFDFKIFCPHTRANFTVMHIKLKNEYPHIVLDNKENDRFTGSISEYFGEDSRIHLEGNFEDIFKVYAKAPAVDTLRILSPDMMQLMMDSDRNFDIEIYRDNLHLVSNFSHFDAQEIKHFFLVADKLLNKLDRRKATVLADFDSTSIVK